MVDGLKGYPDAITAVFPRTIVQTCIVHLIRNSLSFVSWQDRKRLVPALRAIYRAETAEVAELRLADFEAEWGKKYPAIAPAWRRVWNEVVPFFAYPPQIRKMIYTTNAIESLHRAAACLAVFRHRPTLHDPSNRAVRPSSFGRASVRLPAQGHTPPASQRDQGSRYGPKPGQPPLSARDLPTPSTPANTPRTMRPCAFW